MAAIETLRDALFGNPPSATTQPSREGLLAAFTELATETALAVSSIANGLLPFATVADMNADTTQDDGTLAYVYANNGSSSDPANLVYQWNDGGSSWIAAPWYFNAVAGVLIPILDARLPQTSPFGTLFSVKDTLGNAGIALKSDGTLLVVRVQALYPSLAEQSVLPGHDGFAWSVKDGAGNVAGGFADDGTFTAKTIDADSILINGQEISGGGGGEPGAGSFRFNIEHLPSYGQSLSIGAQAYPVISTTQRFDALMFEGGILTQHPDDSANYYDSLVPAIATNPADHEDGYVGGETPLHGAADMIKERIATVSGIDHTEQSYQLLLSAPGEGGLSIDELDDGTAYFDDLKANITNGFALAQAAGKTYGCRGLLWTQGEEDNSDGTAVATYKAALTDLLADFDAHVKATTGQTDDVHLIFYQLQRYLGSGPLVQQALLELSISDDHMHLATPMYHFAYADTVHLTAESSKWYGAYLGLCFHRVVVMGEEWSPVRPIGSFRQGAIAEIQFEVPVKPLVIDEVGVPTVAANGFKLFQADGTTPITISSVTVTQPDRVRIVAGATIPANAVLKYAIDNGAGDCGPTGHRGNIRDSQGDTIRFDPAGLNRPMHNWCVMFSNFVIV